MRVEKIKDIIHNTIYTCPAYPHIGNDYILAANWILNIYHIKDIDTICELAKILEKNSTYDHEISDKDLAIILAKLNQLLVEYRNKTDLDYLTK